VDDAVSSSRSFSSPDFSVLFVPVAVLLLLLVLVGLLLISNSSAPAVVVDDVTSFSSVGGVNKG